MLNSRFIEPNEHGGFNVFQSVGAAREHVGTFKRRQDAEQFCAAPELLEACKAMLFWLETPEAAERSGIQWRDLLEPARAALKKAGAQ